MLLSAEVRWFWEGDGHELRPWFETAPFKPGGGGSREDVYVLDPGQVELGLKSRGSKPGIEAKALVAERGELTLGPLRAAIQIWTKVTSAALRLDGLETATTRKQRWLRKFSVDGAEPREIELGADEKPKRGDPLPVDGCNVELTRIELDSKPEKWATLGFEAFGRLDRIEATLAAIVSLFGRGSFPKIDPGSALSYPAWLVRK